MSVLEQEAPRGLRGVVVTDTLFRTHPDLSEGRLAKLRAAVVNARALAQVARTIGLASDPPDQWAPSFRTPWLELLERKLFGGA